MSLVDDLHRRLRSNPLAYRLVIGTRILLCAGFLPTGIVKLLGRPFTIMDPSTPVGLFFHAMHQSGAYWRFIGLTQIVASLLLLIPAVAHLGAMVFFPVIVNIVVITVSMEFKGTPAVTVMMLMANLLLLAWDYHRWRGLLTTQPLTAAVPEPRRLTAMERWLYVLGAVFGITFFLGTRSLVPRAIGGPAFIAAAITVLAVLIVAMTRPWRRVAA
jgi:hypothetical protein